MNHWRFEDLLKGVDVLELRVGVLSGVKMVNAANFRKVFGLGTVPVEVLVVCFRFWIVWHLTCQHTLVLHCRKVERRQERL